MQKLVHSIKLHINFIFDVAIDKLEDPIDFGDNRIYKMAAGGHLV